jgi:hypothetical protein
LGAQITKLLELGPILGNSPKLKARGGRRSDGVSPPPAAPRALYRTQFQKIKISGEILRLLSFLFVSCLSRCEQAGVSSPCTCEWRIRKRRLRRLWSPPPPAGGYRYAPDPVGKKENRKNLKDLFLSRTKDKYLIADCEEKSLYLSSHTNPRGFSHGKTKSQFQHTKH